MRRPTCVVYCRLSRADDLSTSIDTQIAACRTYAESQGWHVLVVSDEDNGVSGASKLTDRPGTKRAQASSSVDFMVYRTDALTASNEYRNAVQPARTAAGREYEESTPAPNELVNPIFADRVELKRRWKLGEFADRTRGVVA